MESGLIIAILVAIFSALGSKNRENGNKKRGKKSLRDLSESLNDMLGDLGEDGGTKKIRDFLGRNENETPYIQASEWDDGDEPQTAWNINPMEGSESETHTAANHMQSDDEYVYRVEHAFGEQGMDGDVAAQGCATVKDIRIVKKQKPDKNVVSNEQLLRALNDMPSAIVAAEILGPPRSRRRAIHPR